MQEELNLNGTNIENRPVSPFEEMGAYEHLWIQPRTTFKSLSSKFDQFPGSVPSDFVEDKEQVNKCAKIVRNRFTQFEIDWFGVQVHGAGEYPNKLKDARYPVALLYYRGWWDLTASRSIAVIGTRNPTRGGLTRARQVVRQLVENKLTVVSGLAAGIDTMAHKSAIEENGNTIAVIGTPLSYVYPKENSELQNHLAKYLLVISQIPLMRYESQDYRYNRTFFPDRNVTMSALTEATIIIEAGETSGTLFQARAAVNQKRKLFILDSCFRNIHITWPEKFEKLGAIRVRDYDDIANHLSN
ncbi:MAG: DNA-processing protein DprA [Gammaproteobacteria bacterium]|nr:DNA-processing protein DprA [Gammaproteobacteria bacterium]